MIRLHLKIISTVQRFLVWLSPEPDRSQITWSDGLSDKERNAVDCCKAMRIAYFEDMIYIDPEGYLRNGSDFVRQCPWCGKENDLP